jgi:two-component system chemotaxis response regulator CheY
VTLDVTMPVMDGLETAEDLAARHPGVRVIMLSAMGDEDLVQRARNLGVRHFLTKPFDATQPRRTIFDVLREGV